MCTTCTVITLCMNILCHCIYVMFLSNRETYNSIYVKAYCLAILEVRAL